MHKTDLIKEIANNADLSQKDAGSALDAFIKVVTKALQKGDTVALIGVGTFKTIKTAARKVDQIDDSEVLNMAANLEGKYFYC